MISNCLSLKVIFTDILRKPTSDRSEKKSRKPAPEKKVEKTPATKVEPVVKTKEEKAVSKVSVKKSIQPPESTSFGP